MMKKNIITSFLLALTMSLGFVSCEDMLTPDMDRNADIDQIANDTLYSYWGILRSLQGVAERYVVLGECRGDMVNGTQYVSDSINAILDFGRTGDASDGACRYLQVRDFYHVINSCNTFMAQCDTTRLTGTGKSMMMKEYAQVAAIRAWVYMQLVLAYGEVPCVTTPMTSTQAILDFRKNAPMVNADNLAASEIVTKLEEVRNADYPTYGNYGRTTVVANATECLFPQNLVLGDIYLLAASKTHPEYYAQAAQRYYDFLNTKLGGPIRPESYYGTMTADRTTDLFTLAGNYSWTSMFRTTSAVSSSGETVTVIPSSTNKLWGHVLRGVNDLFGFTTELSVSTDAQDTVTSARVYLSINYEHELQASPAYVALNKSQVYEYYQGTFAMNTCTPVDSAGDARAKMATLDITNDETNEPVNFVLKQNPGMSFSTTYPVIYRKGNIWLRFAEALNGAGFPGYAFAILKCGLCGNSQWVPSSTTQFTPKTYKFFDKTKLVAGQDTTFYDHDTFYDTYLPAEAATASVDVTNATYYQPFVNARRDSVAATYENWPNKALRLAAYHISKAEMFRAKTVPYLNFSTPYLRGSVTQGRYNIAHSIYNMGRDIYDSQGKLTEERIYSYPTDNSGEPVTMGIHNRGCGILKYDEINTTYNYVDQVNKMRKLYENKAALTMEQIYADGDANLADLQEAVGDLILDEMALETSFEGNRFFDLVRFARHRGDNDQLARRVAKRGGSMDGSLRSYLTNDANWYFKLP